MKKIFPNKYNNSFYVGDALNWSNNIYYVANYKWIDNKKIYIPPMGYKHMDYKDITSNRPKCPTYKEHLVYKLKI